jgi:hypothetical protein
MIESYHTTVIKAGTSTAFLEQLAKYISSDKLLYIFSATYSLAVLALVIWVGDAHLLSYQQYFPIWSINLALILPVLIVSIDVVQRILIQQESMAAIRRFYFSTRRFARFTAGILLAQFMILFMGAFTTFKNAMPAWRGGFPYDRLQADIDKWLHLGIDPIQYLTDCCSAAWFVTLMEMNYSKGWFLVVYGAMILVLIAPQFDLVRKRFMLEFMLIWILCGNVLALGFLSAGPAFFGQVTGEESRFALLASVLEHNSGFEQVSVNFQKYLWNFHESGKAGFATGISAFPSVHVAITAMIAAFAWEYDCKLGLLAFAYAALICFSSVLLGWHYAIDGYFSIAFVLLVHWLLRRAFGLVARGKMF